MRHMSDKVVGQVSYKVVGHDRTPLDTIGHVSYDFVRHVSDRTPTNVPFYPFVGEKHFSEIEGALCKMNRTVGDNAVTCLSVFPKNEESDKTMLVSKNKTIN